MAYNQYIVYTEDKTSVNFISLMELKQQTIVFLPLNSFIYVTKTKEHLFYLIVYILTIIQFKQTFHFQNIQ